MAHYKYAGWGYDPVIHWSCKKCLVRACCVENCYKTELIHPLCDDCSGCKKPPCKKVETSLLFERVYRTYGKEIFRYYDEQLKSTSLLKFYNAKKGELRNDHIWKPDTL